MLVECLGFSAYIFIGVILAAILVKWLMSKVGGKDNVELNWFAIIFCIPFWPIVLVLFLCFAILVAIHNWKIDKHSNS